MMRNKRGKGRKSGQRSAELSVEVTRTRRARKRTPRAVHNQHDVFKVTSRGRLLHVGSFAGGAALAFATTRLRQHRRRVPIRVVR